MDFPDSENESLKIEEEDDDAFLDELAESGEIEERDQKENRNSNKRSREDEDEEEGGRKEEELMGPPPPQRPAYYDLGTDPFRSFGLQFVVSTGIEATVEYKSTESPMIESVKLEIVNERAIVDAGVNPASIKSTWLMHTSDWPSRSAVVFKGVVAATLAPLVKSAQQVKTPSLSGIVLREYFPSAVHNPFQSPYTGTLESEATNESWHRRHAEIHALKTALDVRVASKCTRDLAEMHENCRTMKPVFNRGARYEHNVPYFKNMIPTDGEKFDLEKCLLALYVYNVHIDAWSATLKGDKAVVVHEMRILKSGLGELLKAEYAV
jgi:uncharacterized protein YndB with AHSA1/START domain